MTVSAVEKSDNSKLGKGACSATHVSQASCPTDCAFRNAGCYAEGGFVGMATARLNRSTEKDTTRIARMEATAIDGLTGQRPLRLHVVGDSRTNRAARIVSAAARRYRAKHGKPVWTYTHAWKRVRRDSWGNVSVLASCETTADAQEAMRQGYAAALVVDQFRQESAYLVDGLKILPCPAQTRAVTCARCRLCWNAERLLGAELVIAFAAHGGGNTKGALARRTLLSLQTV